MKKRIVSMILSAALLISLFSACSGGQEPDADGPSFSQDAVEAEQVGEADQAEAAEPDG